MVVELPVAGSERNHERHVNGEPAVGGGADNNGWADATLLVPDRGAEVNPPDLPRSELCVRAHPLCSGYSSLAEGRPSPAALSVSCVSAR